MKGVYRSRATGRPDLELVTERSAVFTLLASDCTDATRVCVNLSKIGVKPRLQLVVTE